LPIKIDDNAKEDEIPYLAQKNEYDIDFLAPFKFQLTVSRKPLVVV